MFNPSNDTQPVSDMSDEEELVKEILDNLRAGRDHLSKWRVDAREDYDFYAGVQWSEDDVRILEEQQRPAVTFNRIPRTINVVAGLELQNRQEVRFIPRKLQDTGVNELLTNAAQWVRDQCDAEDEESEAFQDALKCGMGWTETRLDYEQDEEGQILVERIDPLEMVYDPNAKKHNLADARWVAHVKELEKTEAQDLLRKLGSNIELESNSFWNDVSGSPHDATHAFLYENDQSDKISHPNTYSFIQYQWYEVENDYHVLTPQGNIVQLNQDRFDKLKEQIVQQNMRYAQKQHRSYYQAFMLGNELIKKMPLEVVNFTFKCVTGLKDRNRNVFFGLIALMKDPQRWANKWMSQIQYILNTGAKSGVIAEKSAIQDARKFEEEWAQPGSVSILNDGGLGRIQQKEAPRYPDGLDKLMTYAIQSINDVPGVSSEMLGMTDRDQPIGLENMRKNSGITLLATFFDSLRRYRKQQGRILADYIKNYIADGRLIRITGQEGVQYLPLLRDQLTYQYDIIVDDAPSSPNMKERVYMILRDIIPLAMGAGIPVPPDVLDYAPIPEALAMKWKGMVTNAQSNPQAQEMDQIKKSLAYLEIEHKYAETQKLNSDATLNMSRAQKEQYLGQDEAMQAAMKSDILVHQHNMEMHAQNNQQSLSTENQAHQHAMQLQQMHQDNARNNHKILLENRRKVLQDQMNAQLKAQQMRAQMSQPQ